jgi:hypothetical protein
MRALALALLLAGFPAHAQMYKCKDAKGVVQYSDKPCPEGTGKEVDIRGQPPISGKLTPHKEDLKRAERDFQRRQIQQTRQDEAQARQVAQQKQRCDAMRARLQRLNATRRPADAAVHDAQIRSLGDEIAQKCR